MLLTCLAGLLCDGSLYSPAVSKSASLESLCISRKVLDSCISDAVGKSLELGILRYEVCLASKADEEDFLEEYSKELQILIPWDYKKQGCKVYGGAWLQEELIQEVDRHFYEKGKNGMREFCVGVNRSFQTLKNVILENVKTAENMLIAYEHVQRGITPRAKLIGYAHGYKGERDYERDRKKYKPM